MDDQHDFICRECHKHFGWKRNLYAHLRKTHGCVGASDPVPVKERSQVCRDCGKAFTKVSTLNSHTKKAHSYVTAFRNQRIQCPRCDEKFTFHSSLRNHLIYDHDVDLVYERCEFTSEEEFERWKTITERETSSRYVKDSATTLMSDGSKRRHYNCHRSHQYRNLTNALKSKKGFYSKKSGSVCPSRLEVLIQNSSYCVNFWRTHVGHSSEVKRRYLTKHVRAEIADKLKRTVNVGTILEEYTHVKRKDLYNIVRDYNIHQHL